MTRIVQIVPYMRSGVGIPAVAWNLDREFRALGVETEVFTFEMARQGVSFRYARGGLTGRLATIRRVLWFRLVGSRRAREYMAERPDAVSICHSEALAGDVFVYHGSVIRALRAAGRPWRSILLNPVQSIGYLHDRRRYHGRTHRRVVTLTERGPAELRRLYGRVRPRQVTIPNGVDLTRFSPIDLDERRRRRAELGLDDEDRVALFIGHDLAGKRVDLAIEALVHAPTVLLLVVGGDESTVKAAREHADLHGVTERVLLVGPQPDVERFLGIADMFVFPSGYESFALVILEALACGVPVVAARVGVAPDVIRDGENGFLVAHDSREIGDRMELLAAADPAPLRARARESVLEYSWSSVARRYLELVEEISAERTAAR